MSTSKPEIVLPFTAHRYYSLPRRELILPVPYIEYPSLNDITELGDETVCVDSFSGKVPQRNGQDKFPTGAVMGIPSVAFVVRSGSVYRFYTSS